MTYYDSATGDTITHDRAMKELQDHGLSSGTDIQWFYEHLGQKRDYDAQEVLVWLGY